MSSAKINVNSAYLASAIKQQDRFLFVGRVQSDDNSDLCFYLFELLSPLPASQKIKKTISSILEQTINFSHVESEGFFENIILKINNALNSIAQKGDNSWLGKVNGLIGLIEGRNLYLAATGRTFGYIFRKGKISALIDGAPVNEEPHPARTFSDITAGRINPDDKFVFGNCELFNHLSLDRIRRVVETASSKEAVAEFYRNFRKAKIYDVNSLVIDTASQDEKNDPIQEEQPDSYILGKDEESVIKGLQNKLLPKAKKYNEHLKKYSALFWQFSKDSYSKGKKNWDEKYNPETKKLLSKSNQFLSDKFKTTTKKINPHIQKIAKSEKYQNFKVKTFHNPKNDQWKKFVGTSLVLLGNLKILFQKENRKYLLIIVIVIFVAIGYLKIQSNNSSRAEKKREQEVALSYDKAEKMYAQAKEDIGLGKSSDINKLFDSLALAKEATGSADKEKAEKLVREIQDYLDKITKTTRLYNPTPIITFNNETKKIVLGGKLLVSISTEGKIFQTDIAEREPKLVASINKDDKDIKDMAYLPAKEQIAMLSTNNSVNFYNINDKSIEKSKLADGAAWGNANSVSNFATNLYILDSDKGAINKHTETNGVYNDAVAYTNSKNTDLKNATGLSVDGNIYVLKNNGAVLKFSRGTLESGFEIKNIPSPKSTIEEPTKIYTDSDTNYIFVFDKKNNRILRFAKTGEFVSQYAVDNMAIDDFAVNGKIEKLWILSSNKVFEIDL